METRKFTPSAPVAPALWPTTRSIRPAKRRFPNTIDEPRNIGYYLKPLLDITKRPDRDEILKTYLKGKHSINSPFHSKNVILLL